MSTSGASDDRIPDYEALAEGYKTEIKQSLRTVKTLQDPQGIRLITTFPVMSGEVEDIIRRMEEYEPKEGKRRVSTALELYYEQAGKDLYNEPAKKFLKLWDQLKASATQVATAVQDAITNMNQQDTSQANQQDTSQTKQQNKSQAVLPVFRKLWAARSALYEIERCDLGLENEGIEKYEPEKRYYEGKGELQYPEKEDLLAYRPLIRNEKGPPP